MFAACMRIGVLFGAITSIEDFLCLLYHENLIYPRVVWILSNEVGNWYNTKTDNCSAEEMRQATHGVIHFDYQLNTSNHDDIITVTNKTFTKYYSDYLNEVRKYAIEVGDYNVSSDNVSLYSLVNDWATLSYDALWTLGLALDKAEKSLNMENLSLLNSSLGNDTICCTVLKKLKGINFNGASGRVKFDSENKRELTITIHQVQYGHLVRIGSYSPSHNTTSLGKLDLDESALLWSPDNPPLDDFKTETALAHMWAGIVMLILLVIGFLWNSFSLMINFRYHNFHSIKASSPPLNYMIFAGNNALLLAGIVIVTKSLKEHNIVTFSTLCRTHNWLFDLGLLLVLNTTLLKSWRIYRLFHNVRRKPSKMITDNVFITVTIGWILLNTLYRLIYVLVDDRIVAMEKVLTLEDQRIVYCPSWDLWGLFYLPHFAIAVILCVLAFSIRKVERKQFNDAANIAIFFYTTAPVAGICATLSFVLSPANNVYNLTTVSLILDCVSICCIVFMCQLTLFIPKMLPLFKQWCR